MKDEFKIEGVVGIDCEKCGKKSLLLALQVEPGAKCQHCGAVLTIGDKQYTEKAVILDFARNRDDVKLL